MKVICVGRNYQKHAEELKNPLPEEPLLFIKPHNAVIKNNFPFDYPDFSKDVHYEVELVARIRKNGKRIEVGNALDYIDGIGVGIDFTARDLQAKCKEKGWPWEIAKGFDHSAPVSELLPRSSFANLRDIPFRLDKNNITVQEGHSGDMIFSFAEIIAYSSKYFTLNIGDLIFTGTPAGVGPVEKGDLLEAYINDQRLLTCEIK